MGFLKRLFGGSDSSGSNKAGGDGIFLYVKCGNCGDKVRLFIHKSHELNPSNGGYIWHKTIVDNKCFRPIKTVVTFDSQYNIINSEIDGAHYITQVEYEALEESQTTEPKDSID